MEFIFSWVIRNQLACGTAPVNLDQLKKLEFEGIKSILSLCSEEEISNHVLTSDLFECERVILPDHKSDMKMTQKELQFTIKKLSFLLGFGPTFVHCYASMERSPLICIAWLMQKKNITLVNALDYMMRIHPRTSPLSDQLQLIENLKNINLE